MHCNLAYARARRRLAGIAACLTAIAAPAAPPTPTSLPGAEAHVYRELAPEPLRLHVFKPEGWTRSDRRPALVYFFGGGFVRGTPRNSADNARLAAQWGMVGIAPDYRTQERFGTHVGEAVADARAALRWVQEQVDELGIDPARVVVGGSSAGGHLALWTALRHTPPGSKATEAPLAPPAALILVSPAADTAQITDARAARFGGHAAALSPLQHLDLKMPPVLLFHGDADMVVPYAQATALAEALWTTNNRCEFITVPGGGHSFTREQPSWREKMTARQRMFLEKQKILPTATDF